MSHLHVLFMARRFPPAVGGMEKFAYDLSLALEHKHKLVKITWGGTNTWLPVVLPLFFIRGLWTLMTQQIDIIHMQDGVLAPIGWLLAKLSGKPYIVVAHGLDVTYKNTLYQSINVGCIRRADAVVAISAATMHEVLSRRISAHKVRVITIGVNDVYLAPKADRALIGRETGMNLQDRQLLLTTGRLVRRKGVAWFISNVLPKLLRKYPDVLYIVAGEGEQRQAIELAIKETKLERNVQLLGMVSDALRSALYQSCDVFVMPNIRVEGDMEGFGIVALEAATAGLPIVASNIEGIRDAIKNGENGNLVTSTDSNGFISEILQLLASKKERMSRGVKARNYSLNQYSWSHVAQEYTAVYDKLLTK